MATSRRYLFIGVVVEDPEDKGCRPHLLGGMYRRHQQACIDDGTDLDGEGVLEKDKMVIFDFCIKMRKIFVDLKLSQNRLTRYTYS